MWSRRIGWRTMTVPGKVNMDKREAGCMDPAVV